jgi:hypothetical protein
VIARATSQIVFSAWLRKIKPWYWQKFSDLILIGDYWQAIPRATNQIIFSAWQPMLKSFTP